MKKNGLWIIPISDLKYLLYILLLICSCRNKDLDSIPQLEPNSLKLDWMVSLAEDNHFTLTSNTPILLKDEIAFFYDATSNEKILFVEKGGLNHFRKTDLFSSNAKFACLTSDNKMLVNDYKNLYSISSSNNIKHLCSAPSNNQFNVRNNLIGDYLYLHGKDPTDLSGHVHRVNIHSGHLVLDKKVVIEDFPGSKETVVYSPTFYVTTTNDTLLNYSHLIWYQDSASSLYQIIHKQSGNELWRNDEGISFRLQSCVVQDGNNVITYGNKLNSFDAITGSLNWEFEVPSSWGYYGGPNSILKVGNRVYLIVNGRLVGINIKTGILEYSSPKILSTTTESKLSFFEGVIYFTALDSQSHSCIFGIRESDGKIVIHMRSPNSGKKPYYFDTNFRYSGLVIDSVNRKGYTSDGFFGMCFSIPEKY